jgi:hypothetical protein
MAELWLECDPQRQLVVNAIVYSPGDGYLPPDGLVIVPRGDSEAWIGWGYVDGELVPPDQEGLLAPPDEETPEAS